MCQIGETETGSWTVWTALTYSPLLIKAQLDAEDVFDATPPVLSTGRTVSVKGRDPGIKEGLHGEKPHQMM